MSIPTQDIIDIAGIKDGIVILRDGGYRIIMSVSTVNFALKSEQEQNSLIFQYQSFLNSLHFPIEIVMRSKRLDLTPYLQKISVLINKQDNELLRIQTEDYVDFVSKLISLANIMKKTFFVAIPFQPLSLQKASLADKFFNRPKSSGILRVSEDEFKKNSEELRQRANIAATGLGAMGLHCSQLNTEEIIELFYQVYNPEVAGKERVTDADALISPVVEHTSEKKEETKESNQRQEIKIDNTETVQAAQKQQSIQRQQEMLREGEKQIVTAEAQKNSPASAPPTETKQVGDETRPAGQNLPGNQITNNNNQNTL